jgi:N-carbamoyl-L-amino-acid hydrolase
MAEAMREVGLDPELLEGVAGTLGDVAAFVELHIDQGSLVNRAGVPAAGVTVITGSFRWQLVVRGRADHSGAARMSDRRDALVAASEIVLAVEKIATEGPVGELVATVGSLIVRPGAVSVVPGEVVMTVDMRSTDAGSLITASRLLGGAIREISARRDVVCTETVIRRVMPVPLDEGIRKLIVQAAGRSGLRPTEVPSHAGHDAGTMAAVTKVGMVFVRNKSGQSHSKLEDIDWDDAVAGAQLLTAAVREIAGQLEPRAEQK